MEFHCLIAFLLMYFFRPQEWIGVLNSLRPVQLITVFAVYAIFTRPKGFKVSDLFKTPHDWLIFAYFALTVIGSPTPWETFKAIQSVIIIYIVAVQALSSIDRIKILLSWWAVSLMIIAGLALASEYGFDPFGSYDLTHSHMKGRLCLNLSIFNNPNGLGHTLVPVIPMIYLLYFWKRMIGKAVLTLLGIPFWCIWLTESKGAFICSLATTVSTLTFGRPKMVQIAILSLAGVFGSAIFYSLPRMSELEQNTKGNEAIGGRVAAFQFGYECMKRKTFGIGLGNFPEEFFRRGPLRPVRVRKTINKQTRWVWGRSHYYKAPHSSYNQNGAELGYGGLFIFVGILYACLRTLITMKSGDVEQERVRRALFSVVISYVISSWMVDFFYRPTFFLFVAAVGALHRILQQAPEQDDLEMQAREAVPSLQKAIPQLQPALATAGLPASLPAPQPAKEQGLIQEISPVEVSDQPNEQEENGQISWRRIGWQDLVLVWALTYLVIRIWLYSINKF